MLDVLINNAGASYNYEERVVSKVNPEWEQTVVVNAMAPIMVTDLLLDNLKETAEKKVFIFLIHNYGTHILEQLCNNIFYFVLLQ